MIMKDYLPIGTVVLLKNGNKKLTIFGRRQVRNGEKLEYDYIACLYPEGYINDNFRYLFNNEDIETVVYRGYSDAEEEAFCKDVLNK